MTEAFIPQDPRDEGAFVGGAAPLGSPQAAPATGGGPVISQGRAFAWSRFLARQIDFGLYATGFWSLLALTHFDPPILNGFVVGGLFTVLVGVMIDASVMKTCGWTLGKLVFGVSVRRPDGSKLSYEEVVLRNLILWIRGLGLGIPGLNVLCLALSYRDARNGKPCKWDAAPMHVVLRPRIGYRRWKFGVGLVLATFLSSAASYFWATTSPGPSAPPAFAWTNKYTGATVHIPGGWHEMADQEKKRPGEYWFGADSSFMALSSLTLSSQDLDRYLTAVRQDHDYGTFVQQEERSLPAKIKEYVLDFRKEKYGIPAEFKVRVWQSPQGTYWRCDSFTRADDVRRLDLDSQLAKVLIESTLPSRKNL